MNPYLSPSHTKNLDPKSYNDTQTEEPKISSKTINSTGNDRVLQGSMFWRAGHSDSGSLGSRVDSLTAGLLQ